jgi:hypothetical protein
MKNLSVGQDLNSGHHAYERGLLTIHSQRFQLALRSTTIVTCHCITNSIVNVASVFIT